MKYIEITSDTDYSIAEVEFTTSIPKIKTTKEPIKFLAEEQIKTIEENRSKNIGVFFSYQTSMFSKEITRYLVIDNTNLNKLLTIHYFRSFNEAMLKILSIRDRGNNK